MPTPRRTLLALALTGLLPLALVAAQDTSSGPPPGASEPVLAALERAFNAHDAGAVATLVAEDFRWLSVTADGETVEVVSGRDRLRESLREYFAGLPDVETRIEPLGRVGAQVTARETVSWGAAASRRKQASLSVYLIEEDGIARVWYFPAVPVRSPPLPPPGS